MRRELLQSIRAVGRQPATVVRTDARVRARAVVPLAPPPPPGGSQRIQHRYTFRHSLLAQVTLAASQRPSFQGIKVVSSSASHQEHTRLREQLHDLNQQMKALREDLSLEREHKTSILQQNEQLHEVHHALQATKQQTQHLHQQLSTLLHQQPDSEHLQQLHATSHTLSQDCGHISQQHAATLHAELLDCRADKECIVCYESLRTVVYLPCAHFVSCRSCADRVSKCPKCRTRIKTRVRIHH